MRKRERKADNICRWCQNTGRRHPRDWLQIPLSFPSGNFCGFLRISNPCEHGAIAAQDISQHGVARSVDEKWAFRQDVHFLRNFDEIEGLLVINTNYYH